VTTRRTKTSRPKACAYCEGSGPFTREHVFGAFFETRSGRRNRHSSTATRYQSVRGAPTIRDVCACCNNSRLSPLDSYGANLLDRYFSHATSSLQGKPFNVSRVRLLRWLLKVSYNSARGTGEQVPSHRKCREFILGEARDPPFPIDVLVGLLPDPAQGRPSRGGPVPNLLRVGEAILPDGQAATTIRRIVALNRFLFLLLGWKPGTPRPVRRNVTTRLRAEVDLVPVTERGTQPRLRLSKIPAEFWQGVRPGQTAILGVRSAR